MRRILITESQLKKILTKEDVYPLNLKDGSDEPDDIAGSREIQVNNGDDDAPDSVTVLDKVSKERSPEAWFGMQRIPTMYRLPEGRELDNAENSGFGINNDRAIATFANNGGGKMVKNVNAEVQSDTEGSTNVANQMRKGRMERYKETNPELYQKNGGDEMLKILDDQIKKQSSAHKIKHASDVTVQDTTPKITQGKKHNSTNGAYYFE